MSRTYCNNCEASRGLAEYPAGTWCYACSVFTPVRTLVTVPKVSTGDKYFNLMTVDVPLKIQQWLQQYYILSTHITKYKLSWDLHTNRIVFPYYENDLLIFAWLRDIGGAKNKWLFSGYKNQALYYLKQNESISNSLVIVEDVISAIRVSDHCDVVALGGTNFSSSLLIPLFLQYKEIIAFFDGDDAGQKAAKKFKERFHLLRKVRIVSTKQDPKCYLPNELKDILK